MRRRPTRLTLLLLALAIGSSLGTGPVSAARATGSGTAAARARVTDAPGVVGGYRLDLADANDFVAQQTFVQCVGASMQMMLNIAGANDRTARTQARLQTIARDLSGPTRAGFQRKGASVLGWTAGLNRLGAGPYRLVGADTLAEALRLAARSIRDTGEPVGLLVWAGRHAWVMSGFEATADPGRTDDFRVTTAIVLDPLYPHGSLRWGPSPAPRSAIAPAVLGRQFVPRRHGTWPGAPTGAAGQTLAWLAGKYVLVTPYRPILVARTMPIAS